MSVHFDTPPRCEPAPELEIFAYAMPSGTPEGGAAVHLALRALGMVMNYNMPLETARKAHARLGSALRAFDLARELAGDPVKESVREERSTAASAREQERIYRARLAIRLGLAEDDIRAVFDLSADELAFLHAGVTGA